MSGTDHLLKTLTHCVRHLPRPWAEEFVSRSTLRRLARAGLINIVHQLVRWPALPLAFPLAVWRPGEPQPSAGAISHAAISRWSSVESCVVPFVVATERAAKLTGGIGPGEIVQPAQATHDMHVAKVYLQLPLELQMLWMPEDHLRSHGWPADEKLPDAMIIDPVMAVDFGGSYCPVRIKAICDWAVRSEVPLAIY